MLNFRTNTWASGEIRGRQIARYLNMPFDSRINSDDIVIAVKALVEDAEATLDYVKSLWIDVVDGYGLIDHLWEHPRLKAIAIGSLARDFIRRRTLNEIVLIPEHHCNFDNELRENRPIKTVGAVYYPGNFDLAIESVAKALKKIGLEFKTQTKFDNRQDVIDFYKSIDIQLCYRQWRGIGKREPPELKNPLKLENAGSFKIPTISFAEPSFVSDFGIKNFMPVIEPNGILAWCKELMSGNGLYDEMAGLAHEKAKEFHIDKIAPLYLELS